MNETQAISHFTQMAKEAARGGWIIDAIEVNRQGSGAIVFGLFEGSPVAHACFALSNPWGNAERSRLERLFMDTAHRAQNFKNTAMSGLRIQKSVKLNQASVSLNIKAVEQDKRVLTGVATSPTPDRQNDIIESLGCQFRNPVPLLWMHDSKMPVGKCFLLPPTDEGVAFKAEIAGIKEDGALKARCDEAWQSVKAGLVTSVSIGFRPLDAGEPLRNGGRRYSSIEVLELSLVTIPAQRDARITTFKDADFTQPSKDAEKEPFEKKPGKVERREPGRGAVKLIPSGYKW